MAGAEASNRVAVHRAFQSVGYELVQIDALTESKLRPDVLAWAADADGQLVRWAVVEVKAARRGKPLPPELALPQLARARTELGTRDHYVVIGDRWFKADESLRAVEPVEGPTPPPYGGQGVITDVSLATSLLEGALRRVVGDQRVGSRPPVDFQWFDRGDDRLSLARDFLGHIDTADGIRVPASREVLYEAQRRAIVNLARRAPGREAFGSHPVIASAVATLSRSRLDRDVLDPFCGTGSFLWAAVDEAREWGRGLSLARGIEFDAFMYEAASAVAASAPVQAEIIHGDVLAVDPPTAQVVISAPPFGLRVDRPFELLDGSRAHEGDIVAVDRVLRVLGHGGRAVLQIAPSFTFSERARRFREFLAHEFWVAAVIGLPSGSVLGSTVGSVLLVIDKAPPGETFIAQLGEDWETQLAPGGAALDAALRHVDDVRA